MSYAIGICPEAPLILVSALCGHIAMWATRQSPYHAPDGLSEVLLEFKQRITSYAESNSPYPGFIKLDGNNPAQHLRAILDNLLITIPQAAEWNERKNGNTAPYGFCSAYDHPHPDNDFIDLGALTNNIARSVMEEYRKDIASDQRIEKSMRWWTWCNLTSRARQRFSKPSIAVNPEIPPEESQH